MHNTFRIAEAQQEKAPLVDVDGSYMYKKCKTLIEGGMQVAPLPCPTPPISGWRAVNKDSVVSVGPLIPTVTNGNVV